MSSYRLRQSPDLYFPSNASLTSRLVVVTSVGAFFRLELLLESDQALPNLVKAFKFRVRNSLASIPLTRLASFLPKLPNLEWLTLLDYQPEHVPILPQADLLHCLFLNGGFEAPHLKQLTFRIPSDWPNPFDCRRYSFLRHYPSLVTLYIVYDHHEPKPRAPFFIPADPVPSAFSHITSLAVKGGASDSSAAIAAFAGAFRKLTGFTKGETCGNDRSDSTNLLPLLPVSLESLTLETEPVEWKQLASHFITRPCDALILRFQALTSLTFGPRTFSSDLLSHIRQLLLLETLHFLYDAFLSLEDLQQRANLPPSLKTIVMDQIDTGKTGWRMDGPFGAKPPKVALGRLGPGWEVPEFEKVRRYFSLESLRKTVESLRGFGIEVKGLAIDAIGVYEESLIEIKHIGTTLAIECGDFVGLKKKYGEEWTTAAKAERRRRKKVQGSVKKERAEARSAGKGNKGGGNAKKKGGGKKRK